MSRVLLLAWRYVAYNKVKTTILTVCLTLTILLPLTAHLLIEHYGEWLMARARATPLVAGAKGNRFDLVLRALYFGSAELDPIRMAEVRRVRDDGLGTPIPLHLGFTARKHPVVGTSLEYFDFRRLELRQGTLPLRLGQAVLGANVAAELQLATGDHLFSDQRSLYDITKTYPLKMQVVGVLGESGSPDDDAVFVDIKTAWVIEGITHGHQDVIRATDSDVILERQEDNVTTSEGIVEYNEVTASNLASFHTHGDPDELPLSAMIILPADRKSATLLKARYSLSETSCLLVPEDVVAELMGLVFKVKRVFDAGFTLIIISTVLFVLLVILLSQRIRRREMETIYKIGCSRMMAFWLQAAELGFVLLMSLAAAAGLSLAAVLAAPHLVRLL